MTLEEMFALPHQQKCLAIYDHIMQLVKQLEKVYRHVGNDNDLFKFQADGMEAMLAVELSSIDIRNDLNEKLTCITEVVCDCEGEDETEYRYTDENGKPAECMYVMGHCRKK